MRKDEERRGRRRTFSIRDVMNCILLLYIFDDAANEDLGAGGDFVYGAEFVGAFGRHFIFMNNERLEGKMRRDGEFEGKRKWNTYGGVLRYRK